MNEYPEHQRDPYGYDSYPSYEYRRRKGFGKSTGFLVALVVLAVLSGIVSCAVNLLDVQVRRQEGSLTVTVGGRQKADRQEEELQEQELTEAVCGDLEKHAYSVNDRIADAELRNLHILGGV